MHVPARDWQLDSAYRDLFPGAHVLRGDLPGLAALIAHAHLLAAAGAHHEPGQQGRAVTHRALALGARPVGFQAPHVRLVSLNTDIRGHHAGQVDQPFIALDAYPAGIRPPGQAASGIEGGAAVGVDSSIGRIAQNVLQSCPARARPHQVSRPRTATHPGPDLDLVIRQETQHRVHGPQPVEQIEHQPDDRLDLLIGIERDQTIAPTHEPGRQRHRELSAPRLRDPARPHPLLDEMQLGFADGSLEPQQQPVVVLGRVIDPFRVAQQRTRERAQLKELMPFPAAARQPGHLHPEHDPDPVQADLGHQPGEPGPLHRPGRRLPQILIDHQHP